jgi:hypothetical protein
MARGIPEFYRHGFNWPLRLKYFTKSADKVREDFFRYFNSDAGSVHWQWDMVNRTADSSDSDSD